MKVVTVQEMVEILKDEKSSSFIHVKMKTEPSNILKKCKETGEINPYYKQVMKITERNFKLVNNYEKRVKTNYEKEGENPDTFVVEPPKGKKHISPCVLTDTETESKFYLMVEMFDEIQGKIEYLHNDQPIDKQLIERFFSQSKPENKKQEIERKVTVLTPNISNIMELSYKGEKYIIQ